MTLCIKARVRQTPACNPQDRFPGGFLGPAANELLGGSLQELVLCPYRKVLIKTACGREIAFSGGGSLAARPRVHLGSVTGMLSEASTHCNAPANHASSALQEKRLACSFEGKVSAA